MPGTDGPDAGHALELAAVAVSLAVKVQAHPVRERPSAFAEVVYESSAKTLGARLRNEEVLSCTPHAAAGDPGDPAPFYWSLTLKAGSHRRTRYTAWLRESPEEVRAVLAARQEAAALRASLPHAQRKKKPWGPL